MPSEHMPQERTQAIGQALKQAREAKGENLAEAAFRIALSPSQLRAIESADLKPFYSASYYQQAVERYAAFLGVTLDQPTSEEQRASDTPTTATPSTEASTDQPSPEITEAAIAIDTTPDDAPPDSRSAETVAEEISKRQPEQPESTTATVSLREKLGTAPETEPEQKQRSPLGWIAFIAAIVIALGVVKVAMEKPAPPTAAETPAPVTPPPAAEKDATQQQQAPSPSPVSKPPTAPTPTPPSPASTPSTAPTSTPTAPQKPAPASPARGADSQLESKVTTWVQLVKANGEKSNLKMEPGQRIEFASADTAAVVFGQPDQASLKVKGRAVNLKPFITQENPSRALVILNQIRE
jgi:transcriptional regulator with XRE-family HTH domain